MRTTNRRTFLKVLGAGAAAGAAGLARNPLLRAFADSPVDSKEFFILIHQTGGWDVTLWSDPRNEIKGLVDPSTTESCTVQGITGWQDQPQGDGTTTFKKLVRGNYEYGPAMGDLVGMFDRFMIVNGISMNTVSHPDGTYYSSTGRHLAGGRPVAASIDTMLANEFGKSQILPVLSVNFPSTFLGGELDARVMPLRVSDVTAVAKSIARSPSYDGVDDRAAVTAVLSDEASDLAEQAHDPRVPSGLALQYEALQEMLGDNVRALFEPSKLKAAHPDFDYGGRFQSGAALNASFAIEAIRRRLVRCVSFATASCDTHNTNYRNHPMILQETFNVVAQLVKELDKASFEGSTDRLSDHVHILVVSDFCRTPQLNLSGGRDHYPNNSSLIVSPRFKTNFQYGKSDPEQLLPLDSGTFSDGTRAVTPADVLATMLGAFGIDPRKYMRDGDVVKDMLR